MGWTPARFTAAANYPPADLGPWEVTAAVLPGEYQRVAGLAGAQDCKPVEHERRDGHRSRLAALGGADGVIYAKLHGVVFVDGQSPAQELDLTHAKRDGLAPSDAAVGQRQDKRAVLADFIG